MNLEQKFVQVAAFRKDTAPNFFDALRKAIDRMEHDVLRAAAYGFTAVSADGHETKFYPQSKALEYQFWATYDVNISDSPTHGDFRLVLNVIFNTNE